MGKVYIIGTLDTKEAELRYARRRAEKAGAEVVLVDVSTTPSKAKADVSAREVARHHPKGEAAVLGQSDRGAAVVAMAEALSRFMVSRRDVGAVLGLGGSGNTVIVTTAMRALPVGVPKLMVSTVASGNVAPYVGPSDIAMMYSVVDVAGLNAISRKVIANAAHAAAGMALNSVKRVKADKPGVGPYHVRRDDAVHHSTSARGLKKSLNALCSMPRARAASPWRSWWIRACWKASSISPRRKWPIICSAAFCRARRIASAPSSARKFLMWDRLALSTW